MGACAIPEGDAGPGRNAYPVRALWNALLAGIVIVHIERRTVHLLYPATGERRDPAFQGFEADCDTLEYRCPAAAYGLT